MKVKYHQHEMEFPSRYANQPVELPASLDAVKGALAKALEKSVAAREPAMANMKPEVSD
jgi:hypothetical protein